MSGLQAVVFDMDGVLIDSEDVWLAVRQAFAAGIGRRWTAADQLATMGCSTDAWSQVMVQRLGLDGPGGMPASEVAAAVVDGLREHYRQHLPVRDGAVAAVQRLAARWPLALATGSPAKVGRFVLDAMGLAPLFAHCAFGDEVANGKPAPDIYRLALDRLGVGPGQAVGIEDSGNGIRSLHAAGMGIIAAPSPQYPVKAEVIALADACIDHLDELDAALVEHVAAHRAPRQENRA